MKLSETKENLFFLNNYNRWIHILQAYHDFIKFCVFGSNDNTITLYKTYCYGKSKKHLNLSTFNVVWNKNVDNLPIF
jgi:hypothetical protein